MENKKEIPSNRILLFFVIIIFLFLIYVTVISNIFSSWQERGTFGDAFGALNALFSGLAFGGIIYTILLQRRELELQRNELQLTRQELTRTAEAQEKSKEALSKQVISMERTAKLNALNSLLNHYTNVRINERKLAGIDYTNACKNCETYIQKIIQLFKEIEIVDEK